MRGVCRAQNPPAAIQNRRLCQSPADALIYLIVRCRLRCQIPIRFDLRPVTHLRITTILRAQQREYLVNASDQNGPQIVGWALGLHRMCRPALAWEHIAQRCHTRRTLRRGRLGRCRCMRGGGTSAAMRSISSSGVRVSSSTLAPRLDADSRVQREAAVRVAQHLFGVTALQQAPAHEGVQDAFLQGGLHLGHGIRIDHAGRMEHDAR